MATKKIDPIADAEAVAERIEKLPDVAKDGINLVAYKRAFRLASENYINNLRAVMKLAE